jgi:hypothetical protein
MILDNKIRLMLSGLIVAISVAGLKKFWVRLNAKNS